MRGFIVWDDFKQELISQPGFKQAMQETEVEFQVARAVIEARLQRGMTQAQLAEAMHTRQSVISRVENAKTVPSLSFLKRLAEVLSASLEIRFEPR